MNTHPPCCHPIPDHPLFQNLTGLVFGRLTVTGYGGRAQAGTQKRTKWRCRCECGAYTTVEAASLKNGHTLSCGCLHRDRFTRLRHGQAFHGRQTKEYRAWAEMSRRCYNRRSPNYPGHGGRGITVWERWRDSFPAFYGDMGAAPSREHSLDRIDNDGPYSPQNCRWATRREQGRNKRNSRRITHAGETLTMTEWSERTGLKVGTIWARLESGWDEARALTTPVG